MAQQNILIFVPVYNCQDQVGRLLDQLEKPWIINSVSRVIFVDNQSTDATTQIILDRIRGRNDGIINIFRNDSNYGLGGSHKVAFKYAIDHGFDWMIVLHGDDQGNIDDFRSVIEHCSLEDYDAYLGSRFMPESSVPGYSKFRIFGNYLFNFIYSICLGKEICDLGSGLNMYKIESIDYKQLIYYPDNLTFNCVLLCAQIINSKKIKFVPISWREDDQVSNVKFFRQSLQTLSIALKAYFNPKVFSNIEFREIKISEYTTKEIDVR